MGDRIVIDITDGEDFSPSFYGHWCGLRGIKVLNDIVRERKHNGIQSMMCNFIMEIMERQPREYSFYIYNHGEVDGAADYDNFTWCFNTKTQTWRTTDPELGGRDLTMEEADEYVKRFRPCLYRECRCEDYGKNGCALKFYEDQDLTQE